MKFFLNEGYILEEGDKLFLNEDDSDGAVEDVWEEVKENIDTKINETSKTVEMTEDNLAVKIQYNQSMQELYSILVNIVLNSDDATGAQVTAPAKADQKNSLHQLYTNISRYLSK